MIIMLEINTPFEILPIKPTYNQQEVEKAKKKDIIQISAGCSSQRKTGQTKKRTSLQI